MRRLPWIVGLALVIGLGSSCIYRAGPTERTDLPVYLAGAREVLAGRDPFGVLSRRGWAYFYPPTLATLLIPLTPLPQRAAAAVWFALSLAALVAGVLAFRRLLEPPPEPDGRGPPFRWREDGIPLALILLPSSSALLRGQVAPLLLGLLGLAALALARRRDVSAGLLIALATAIKITPGLALAGLLAARRWKAAAAALAGLVVWLVLVPLPLLGPRGTLSALRSVQTRLLAPSVAEPGTLPIPGTPDFTLSKNQSPNAQVLKRLEPGPLRSLLVYALAGLSLGAALLACLLGPDPPRPAAWALLLAAPLIAVPLAWHHYHPLLYPALALLLLRGWSRTLLAFALLSLLHFALKPLRPWGLLGLGTLLVYGAVCWSLLNPGPADSLEQESKQESEG